MNLMRQRDDLKRMHELKVISAGQLEMALAAPVFQWWCGDRGFSDEEWEFMTTNIVEEEIVRDADGKITARSYWPKVKPFDVFRISHMDNPIFEQWFIGDRSCMCVRCEDGYSHLAVKLWTIHTTEHGSSKYKMWSWANEQNFHMHDGVRVGKMVLKGTEEQFNIFTGAPLSSLSTFLFDIYSSASSVIKVSDNTPGKSVQWRKSREHYLVLHHKQAKELQQSKRPHTDEDLIRSAHWRRAHLRRLNSGKFVNKRGLLVPVKKAWVGPKEWIGQDKKIYTVVGIDPPGLKS